MYFLKMAKVEKEELKEYLFKEIDLVQDIIRRMAYNSFIIKGWAITLVVVALLLRGSKFQVFIAFVPLLVFWFLDAYFLWQERMYRKLYEWLIKNRLQNDEYLLDMNAYRFQEQVPSRLKTMFSLTLSWFYGAIGILVLIYALFLLTIS